MTLLRSVNGAVDTLDQIAGELLALEATVTRELDDETREHIKTELAAARRRVLVVTQTLHDARRGV
jgi:hypothetical protein